MAISVDFAAAYASQRVEARLKPTMLRLQKAQRRMLVEKVPDLANLAAAGTVFGQFVGGQQYSIGVATIGVVTWIVLIGWALIIVLKEEAS